VRLALLSSLLLVVAALSACGSSEEPDRLAVGVVDDVVRSDPARAGELLDELVDSGFGAVALTSIWEPGLTAPSETELTTLRDVAEAADERSVRLFLRVYHAGSRTTPLTEQSRSEFAAYVAALVAGIAQLGDVIVGNEPNLNRFWLPQFGPAGENVAAPAYLSLLADTYDAVKAVRDGARVWGGATAPRGSDRPGGERQTHSPTTFIRDLGAAFRASGRDRPVMDGFVHHPYAETSQTPIDQPHPRTTSIGLADYDKLVTLLGEAFDGTAQAGSTLPLLYGEVGVETAVPPEKAGLYSGREIALTTDDATQERAYRRALELVSCQPTVAGMLFFHLRDEPLLEGWQSGVRYADGAPKASLQAVEAAALAASEGSLDVRCEP
jgi:hypothetical protein